MPIPFVSSLIINWNEMHLVSQSIVRLLPEVDQLVVVDNGSTDGSQDYLRFLTSRPHEHGGKLRTAILSENTGPSVARNVGLELCHGDYIFLLDGDILYVPGTIEAYAGVLSYYGNVGCVGYNDHWRVQSTGMNGTDDFEEADQQMATEFSVSNWFPMAWTQYGLFDGDCLRAFRFVVKPPFDQPGHGYEDDWLYHELKEEGMESLAVNKPLYYHDGHHGLRNLHRDGVPDMGAERAKVFYDMWGEGNGWRESLSKTPMSDMVAFADWKDGVATKR